MLVQLNISDFAIIRHLEILFKAGLNILSGETGAGKSIIINAVNLILGGRASADLVRTGANEARVEAHFSLPEDSNLGELLSQMGLPFDGELLIKRIIPREGRNKIMINGSMATLQTLSELGCKLISISGQHEHQLLLKPENHLYFLDDFGEFAGERLMLGEAFRRVQAMIERIHHVEREIREREERQDLARFQINEIGSAHLTEGGDVLLEEERRRLQFAEQLMEIVKGCYLAIYEKEDSVLTGLSSCIKNLEKGSEMDHQLDPLKKTLVSAKIELEEVALELRDRLNNLIIDPQRLEEVQERLHLLNRLKKRYGPSLKEVMNFRERLLEMNENLDQKRDQLEKLKKDLIEMQGDVVSRATLLSKKRRSAAKRLERAVVDELRLLEMGGTLFEVGFDQAPHGDDPDSIISEIKPDGYDRVEFMLSPNIGEALRPLSKIASGGELSRIMLALKTILARTGSVETIIFDEVDSGIGGATAEVIGEKLRSLAEYHQILCITHLPQIASKGKTHFFVQKRVRDRRTQTDITELDPQGRINEIARLLGGKVISPKAIAHARELLN
ncbi:MAG: DNA repair protein RecN [Pseudomonadota bacterium]